MAGGITRALLDTSVVIAAADSIALDPEQTAAISVITLGELRAGVALAADPATRAARQARLAGVRAAFRPIHIDETVADAYGEVLATARSQKRMSKATDLLVIGTAAATGRVLHTRDSAQAQLAAAIGIPTRP